MVFINLILISFLPTIIVLKYIVKYLKSLFSNDEWDDSFSASGEFLAEFFLVSALFAKGPYEHLIEAHSGEEICFYIRNNKVRINLNNILNDFVEFNIFTCVASREPRECNPRACFPEIVSTRYLIKSPSMWNLSFLISRRSVFKFYRRIWAKCREMMMTHEIQEFWDTP